MQRQRRGVHVRNGQLVARGDRREGAQQQRGRCAPTAALQRVGRQQEAAPGVGAVVVVEAGGVEREERGPHDLEVVGPCHRHRIEQQLAVAALDGRSVDVLFRRHRRLAHARRHKSAHRWRGVLAHLRQQLRLGGAHLIRRRMQPRDRAAQCRVGAMQRQHHLC